MAAENEYPFAKATQEAGQINIQECQVCGEPIPEGGHLCTAKAAPNHFGQAQQEVQQQVLAALGSNDYRKTQCSVCGQFGLHNCPVNAIPSGADQITAGIQAGFNGMQVPHHRCECHDCTQARFQEEYNRLFKEMVDYNNLRLPPPMIRHSDGRIESPLTPYGQSQIDAAVSAERERCANIAQAAINDYNAVMESLAGEKTWQWALNEMSNDVNAKFCDAVRDMRNIAARIREGK